MVTIKSFTDISQSKKLAEILPIESADMHYGEYCAGGENYPIPNCDDDYNGNCCWSLAALLNILPEYNLQKTDFTDKIKYKIVVTIDDVTFASKNYDNPVDACYETIIKLHELKML